MLRPMRDDRATATRKARIDSFLAGHGWDMATRRPLAGDASARRYERVTLGDRHAVLMDAPPDAGEDVRPFVRMAEHLHRLGLSAPKILAADSEAGLLLLEDLGDAIFARVTEADPTAERPLYAAATDVLAELHRHPPPPDTPDYGPEQMAETAMLAWTWYCRGLGTERSAAECDDARDLILESLRAAATDPPVLVLRDYHAENLIWLPGRDGPARVGLLDFQDAAKGQPAYDLVSLLRDARRDVDPDVQAEMTRRYLDATGRAAAPFARAAATLSAQRNLRILGVFARLRLRDGKRWYVDLIPRVWRHLQGDLAHPSLEPLRSLVTDQLPAPTPERLARLRAS